MKITSEEYYRSFLINRMDEVLHTGTAFEMLINKNIRGIISLDTYNKMPYMIINM